MRWAICRQARGRVHLQYDAALIDHHLQGQCSGSAMLRQQALLQQLRCGAGTVRASHLYPTHARMLTCTPAPATRKDVLIAPNLNGMYAAK